MKRKKLYHDWLFLHLRAWARHNIHFGISGSQSMLSSNDGCFDTLCVEGQAGAITGKDNTIVALIQDEVLTYRFSHSHPEFSKRGMRNNAFLDPVAVRQSVLRSATYDARMFMFRIPHIYRTEGFTCEQFIDMLDPCFHALPKGYHYAIEMHNRDYLLPRYFECLRKHNVAHTVHANPVLPSVLDQVLHPHALSADRAVMRIPVDGDAETQLGVLEMVRRCVEEKKALYVYLQHTETASMLHTLEKLMTLMDPDLAKLSPIRRKAA